MRSVWAILTTLAWGLWFGGMGTLFLLVSYLFVADRATAVVAAPRMFFAFERYQLGVAAVAILSAALWRLGAKRAVVTAIFVLFALTAVGTIVSATAIRPQMERLRLAGVSSGEEFQRLHKSSERLYSAQAVLLLIAGLVLPTALKGQGADARHANPTGSTAPATTAPPPRTEPSVAPPSAPPV